MSNRVYPEVIASYENKNYLVYLYECYGDEGKYYYLSGEPKVLRSGYTFSKKFHREFSMQYIESWLKECIGEFRKCEGDEEEE